jgi:hypothetical protein
MPNQPNFPIPDELTPETFCLCLQIPNDPTWKRVFVGLLAQPTYWFNWQRDEAHSGRQLAQYWTRLFTDIDWSTMSCCCDQPPVQFRWTEDGDLERSVDGGVTWTPAPEYDPRLNSPRFPEPPGAESDDKKCIAATGMTALIKEQVGDNLTDDMARFTLGELISTWVQTMIQSSNPFQALITIAANQIFALVIAVLRPALTEAVYDMLTCIFYCNMADDISFNASQLDNVTTAVGDQIGGVATLFFQQLINLLGVVGLTNLARAGGASSGDCSDCDCTPCIDECMTEWTWYNVTVEFDGCNTYTLTSTGAGNMAFTSGNQDVGCYLDTGLLGSFSYWPVGSASPVGGTNPKVTPVWNADFGNPGAGNIYHFIFSSALIP